MKPARLFSLLALFSLTVASLACSVFVGGPEYPASPIPVSTEAIASLDQQVQAAQTAAAESGVIALSVNETQVTSLLAQKLAAQTDPFMTDPQVFLRNGEIQVYGKVKQGNLEANLRIVLSASIDAEGKPVMTVTSADFGPIPAPEGLNKTISAAIDEAFTGALGPAATGLRLETITIADGVMTLTGRVK
jgi:hypothetical protein